MISAETPSDSPLPARLLPFLWHFVKRHPWGCLALGIFPSIITFVVASMGNATRQITNAVIEAQKSGADVWQAATPPLIYFALLASSTVLLRLVQWTAGYKTRMPMIANIRRSLFGFVQRHDALYFDNSFSGKVAHEVTALPEQSLWILERLWFDVFGAMTFFVTTCFYFFTAQPVFAGLVAGWLAVYYGVILAIGRGTSRRAKLHNEAKTRLTGCIVDAITNIKTVITHAAHQTEDRRTGQAIEETRQRHSELHVAMIRMRFTQHALNVVMWLSLYTGAIYAWSMHKITAGDFVLLTSLGTLLINRAFDLGEMLPDFLDNIASARENLEDLIVPRAILDKPSAPALQVAQGAIRFEGVHFAYHDGAKVFQDFSLTIPAGQRVGLIGTSGAGKTTLTTLLLRLHDVQAGRILIDGQDIAAVTQESLRRAIGLIPQDTMLFHRTLMDNIRYGRPEASEAEVIRAAQRAYADDFIRRLPKGYETLVGERGVKLSGGQRQRIAIARAFLKNAPILILDEATSALDSESEHVIQIAMAEAMRNRTVIAIAHRLSTIAHLDRLIVLKDGAIVEDGTHSELLAHGGVYAQLWHKQSGGFLQEDGDEAKEEEEINVEPLPPPALPLKEEMAHSEEA